MPNLGPPAFLQTHSASPASVLIWYSAQSDPLTQWQRLGDERTAYWSKASLLLALKHERELDF